MKKNQLKIKNFDNKYKNKHNKKEFLKENKKSIKISSYDDIYRKKIGLPGDFVPYKSKNEIKYKHVNVITSDDSFDEPKIIKVYPSIKFNEVKSTQNLKYIKLGDDPRFMYVDYYHNNQKIHKSKLLTNSKK